MQIWIAWKVDHFSIKNVWVHSKQMEINLKMKD